MGAINGRNSGGRALGESPEIAPELKWGILRKIHAEAPAHAAGYAGEVRSLKSAGRSWARCSLGARFLMTQRVEYVRKTTRGCAEAFGRHLPGPLRSGERVGADPNSIPSKNEPGGKWVALLAVAFTPGKVSARDIDSGRVTVLEAQSVLVGDFMSSNDPPVILCSDIGGQLKTVLRQLFQEHLYWRTAQRSTDMSRR